MKKKVLTVATLFPNYLFFFCILMQPSLLEMFLTMQTEFLE